MRLLVTAIVVGTASVAAAQPSLTPPSSVPAGPAPAPASPAPTTTTAPVRHGIVVGADLGFGGLESSNGSYTACSGCNSQTAVGLGFEGGWMFSPRAAIVVGLSIDAKNGSPSGAEPKVTHGQTSLFIGGAYWTSPRLFLEGDIGKAQLADQDDYGNSTQWDSGTSLAGAVGYELISGRHFALDARFRLQAVHYKAIADTVLAPTVAIGLRWFSVR